MSDLKTLLAKAGSVYFEPIEAISLAAGATVKRTFTNQDNIPFLIQKIIGHAEASGTKTFNYKVSFKDAGKSQLLMSTPIHGSALGTGEFPTLLPSPYLLRGSSTFEVDIVNIGTVSINVYLTFIGLKLKSQV